MIKNKKIQIGTVNVGHNCPTALNVLIGTNCKEDRDIEYKKIDELNKSDLPISIITDLSLCEQAGSELWRKIISDGVFEAGTVPVYLAVSSRGIIDESYLLEIIDEQAESGVKLMTIHPTPDYQLIKMCSHRLVPITSRGGSAVCRDMVQRHSHENVYMKHLDDILKIAKKFGVTISIGSSFRSANLKDAMDETYLLELEQQIAIASYCEKAGVNSIIETPGHASPQNIFSICEKLNRECRFPVMPLGPMPTDIAFEQDDLAAAIGAVLMGTRNCADVLSVVTSDEHTGGIPTIDSIMSAIKKYEIAKHIIDIYKINDTDMDDLVAQERSSCSSCILDSKSVGCDRCGKMCPLQFNDLYKI